MPTGGLRVTAIGSALAGVMIAVTAVEVTVPHPGRPESTTSPAAPGRSEMTRLMVREIVRDCRSGIDWQNYAVLRLP